MTSVQVINYFAVFVYNQYISGASGLVRQRSSIAKEIW